MLYIFEERAYLVSLYSKLDMTRHALNTSPPTHFFSNVHNKGIKEVFSSIKKTLANVWFSKTGKGQFGSYLISSRKHWYFHSSQVYWILPDFLHIGWIDCLISHTAKPGNVLQKYKMPNSLWEPVQSWKPTFNSQFCQVLFMFPSSSQPLF